MSALAAEGWLSLDGMPRPGSRRQSIEHLVIGPGGVVVVDSGPWVGRIEVARGVVQQNGFWREAECAEVARIAGSIAALLQPRHRTAVHALICVAQHDLPHHVVVPGVHVVGVTDLVGVLRALPHRLDPIEVAQLGTLLDARLTEAQAAGQLTTADLDAPSRAVRSGCPLEGDPEGPGLCVPVTGAELRSAARGATDERRRTPGGRAPDRRPTGRWRHPRWRLLLIRLGLAALVVVAALVFGPGLAHRALDGRPAGVIVPQTTPMVGLSTGGVEVIGDAQLPATSPVVPAATAREDHSRPPM